MNSNKVILFLLSAICIQCGSCGILYHDNNLYEGSQCDLPNGAKGVCMFRVNCSASDNVEDIFNVCGYKHDSEIVCCSTLNYTGPYPSLAHACGDRIRRTEESIQLDEFVATRSREEDSVKEKHNSEYFELPSKIRSQVLEKCKNESDIFEDEAEKEIYWAECNKTAPSITAKSFTTAMRYFINENPHMALLGWTDENGTTSWKCVGSLIHRSFVITSAHCVDNRPSPDIVRVGDVHLKYDYDDKFAVNYTVEKMVKHDKYEPLTYLNDIAILKVHKTPEYRTHIRPLPACVWLDEDLPQNQLWMMNYNISNTGSTELRSELLMRNHIIVTSQKCVSRFNFEADTDDSQICTDDLDEVSETCQNNLDSGILQYKAGAGHMTPYIVGITSLNLPCETNSPALLTNVHSQLPWIEKVITENYP